MAMAMEGIAVKLPMKEESNGGSSLRFMKSCQISFVVYRCLFLLFCVLLSRVLLQNLRRSNGVLFFLNGGQGEEMEFTVGVRSNKFVEVPQIIWGLNNQKIALARAALTARKLNRTLLMPKLSASLFYKNTDLLQPIPFDKIFSLDRFNSRCRGFVQIARGSKPREAFVVRKGSGRRWTASKDLAQLDECVRNPDIDRHEVIRLEGKHPFLWHDHWPVNDYASVFECLDLVDELSAEASGVVAKLRAIQNSTKYVAVHMRIEKDWMIHCKKVENRAKIKEGKNLRICSSREEIMQRVSKIPGLEKPSVVYLAVADDLLEDKTLLEGWSQGLVPYEKKNLGVVSTYAKYPYLIKSAIDYEVCLQADVFVGNSFSTFSSLVVLQRTVRKKRGNFGNGCEGTYAYNLEGPGGGSQRWATNMSDSSLAAISYGSNHVSCT
ncbi:hypothetical protein SUGI_0813840 [Cryptomeria japonica]|uniref:O-fucosyltransferase 23 n=1 Tax=Cryptomeria japonica TaxID=3369 RepID=UPI002414BE75|nr:O-fucosyltransferase 23 [Cryptomeria japonica]GLJ39814.1 hypothetical protein SUGI_0813840 [Cryptomeria japonica]